MLYFRATSHKEMRKRYPDVNFVTIVAIGSQREMNDSKEGIRK